MRGRSPRSPRSCGLWPGSQRSEAGIWAAGLAVIRGEFADGIKSCCLNGYSLALSVCQTRWHGDRSWQEPRRSSTNCGGSVSVSVFSSLYEIRKRINLFLNMKLFQKCDGRPSQRMPVCTRNNVFLLFRIKCLTQCTSVTKSK